MRPIGQSMAAVAFLAFALVGPVRAADDLVKGVFNFFDGKKYDLSVTESQIDKAPLWADKDENPPLSVRAAEKLARDYVKRVVPKSNRWEVRRISLEPVGKGGGHWIYLVEFTPFKEDQVIFGSGHPFNIPVLLNGVVPEAKVTDYPGR